jgi:hypothetical protein
VSRSLHDDSLRAMPDRCTTNERLLHRIPRDSREQDGTGGPGSRAAFAS